MGDTTQKEEGVGKKREREPTKRSDYYEVNRFGERKNG